MKASQKRGSQKDQISLLSSLGSTIQKFFDLVKKPIDDLDDIWPGFRVLLPSSIISAVGPYIMGVAGIIVHLGEGLKNGKIFVKAYRDESMPQRKTRMGTGFLASIFASAGVSIASVLIAGAAGAKVLGEVFMPSILSGLLTSIYALVLIRKSYSFKGAKQQEALAKQQLPVEEHEKNLYKENDFKNLQDQVNNLNIYLKSLQRQIVCSGNDREQISALKEELQKRQKECEYLSAHRNRLVAERRLAYSVLEFSNTAVIFVGSILLTSAFIAGSAFSLGTLPAALSLGGAIAATLCNVFKFFDKNDHYRKSGAVRRWAINAYQHLFSSSDKNQTSNQIAHKHQTTEKALPVNHSNNVINIKNGINEGQIQPETSEPAITKTANEVNLIRKKIDENVREKNYTSARFFSPQNESFDPKNGNTSKQPAPAKYSQQ